MNDQQMIKLSKRLLQRHERIKIALAELRKESPDFTIIDEALSLPKLPPLDEEIPQ